MSKTNLLLQTLFEIRDGANDPQELAKTVIKTFNSEKSLEEIEKEWLELAKGDPDSPRPVLRDLWCDEKNDVTAAADGFRSHIVVGKRLTDKESTIPDINEVVKAVAEQDTVRVILNPRFLMDALYFFEETTSEAVVLYIPKEEYKAIAVTDTKQEHVAVIIPLVADYMNSSIPPAVESLNDRKEKQKKKELNELTVFSGGFSARLKSNADDKMLRIYAGDEYDVRSETREPLTLDMSEIDVFIENIQSHKKWLEENAQNN